MSRTTTERQTTRARGRAIAKNKTKISPIEDLYALYRQQCSVALCPGGTTVDESKRSSKFAYCKRKGSLGWRAL